MWYEEAVFYQIYPLGFCGAPIDQDEVVKNRIEKVKDWSEHLEKLGISAVYFSPIFESDHHGYDTRDFLKIDSRLGDNQAFKEVVEDLHSHQIKVVLDGVFNHVGRNFFAFLDVKEKKWDSPYKDWFYINFDGDSCYQDGFWYEGWEGHFELVKLNLKNPQVVEYLLDCVKQWIGLWDIDGIRLDVAYSLDHDFIRRLRGHCDNLKKEFFLVGEMLHGDYNILTQEGMLHSVTNYECYKGLYSSFNSMNMFEIAHSIHRQFGKDNWCLYRGKHLLCFVDNHDVSRIASQLENDKHLVPIYGLLMSMPGIPCIYYGSEWGALGKKEQGSDWNLRPSFAQPEWNQLTEKIACMAGIHKQQEALVYGGYEMVHLTNHQYMFERRTETDTMLVAINASADSYTAHFSQQYGQMKDLLGEEEYTVNGEFAMAPYSVYYLKKN